MTYPWQGAAQPLSFSRLLDAAKQLEVEPAVIRAVWMTEAGGKYFNSDNSVIRRFEPHKMPNAATNWRDSFPIKKAKREQMFLAAYDRALMSAMDATSFGAGQIMGFNHLAAGYPTSLLMVEALADAADNHVGAFVNLIDDWGLTTTLRAKDWRAFTRRYNGSGQVDAYSAIMERHYKSLTGRASPKVLKVGSKGDAVKELQKLLGVFADGDYGPWTEQNVIRFQRDRGLVADGIVGAKTWEALKVTDPPVKGIFG